MNLNLNLNMMPAIDVINKLYNTVSHTVNQISYALPGNAVTKDYDVYEQIASAGPGLLWKIYSGSKKTTKQPVSVFVVEKKSLERYQRAEREALLDLLKEGAVQLTKIRHPRVLTVQHPLEESRDSIAFATEPVFASLANVLGDRRSMAPELPATKQLKDFALHEVEIKAGLLQLAEALQFLHADAKLLHRNVCPESVVINKEGGWKLMGFEYCVLQGGGGVAASSGVGVQPATASNPWPIRLYQPHASPPLLQPSLDYLAPEHICSESNEPASDLYSLALLIYTLHSPQHTPPHQFHANLDAFRRNATDLLHGTYPNLRDLPAALADHVRLSLHARPTSRPAAHELAGCSYFTDVRVAALHSLDNAFQWSNLQKSKFYKELPAILAELPPRIQRQHVLPALQREFASAAMIPFVLPAYFHIAAECSRADYARLVHPALRPVLRMPEPIQILLILVQNIELLLRQTAAAELQADVLPMLYRALETDQPQMQEMCLSVLPAFAKSVDLTSVKNGILPRIRALCTAPQTAAVLVCNGLACVGHLLEVMDKWMVLDEVVPLLQQVRRREPAVIVAVVAVLQQIVDSSRLGVTRETIAQQLVPWLMPMCLEPGLAVTEFEMIIGMVKRLVEQVEREQREKLRQLGGMRTTTAAATGSQPAAMKLAPPPGASIGEAMMKPVATVTPPKPKATMGMNSSSSSSISSLNSIRNPQTPAAASNPNWASDFGGFQQTAAAPKIPATSSTRAPNYNINAPSQQLTSPNANTVQQSLQPFGQLALSPTTSSLSAFQPQQMSYPSQASQMSWAAQQPPSASQGLLQQQHQQQRSGLSNSSTPMLAMRPQTTAMGNGNSSGGPNSSAILSQQDILDFLK